MGYHGANEQPDFVKQTINFAVIGILGSLHVVLIHDFNAMYPRGYKSPIFQVMTAAEILTLSVCAFHGIEIIWLFLLDCFVWGFATLLFQVMEDSQIPDAPAAFLVFFTQIIWLAFFGIAFSILLSSINKVQQVAIIYGVSTNLLSHMSCRHLFGNSNHSVVVKGLLFLEAFAFLLSFCSLFGIALEVKACSYLFWGGLVAANVTSCFLVSFQPAKPPQTQQAKFAEVSTVELSEVV